MQNAVGAGVACVRPECSLTKSSFLSRFPPSRHAGARPRAAPGRRFRASAGSARPVQRRRWPPDGFTGGRGETTMKILRCCALVVLAWLAGASFAEARQCSFTLTPTTFAVGSTASLRTLSIITGTQCSWTAVSGVSWITVSSGAAGYGHRRGDIRRRAEPHGRPAVRHADHRGADGARLRSRREAVPTRSRPPALPSIPSPAPGPSASLRGPNAAGRRHRRRRGSR